MWSRTTRTGWWLAVGALLVTCGKPAKHAPPSGGHEAAAKGGAGSDVDVPAWDVVDEATPDAAAKRIECSAPTLAPVNDLPVTGILCGRGLQRLGLARGVDSVSCGALRGTFAPQTRTCRVSLPFYAATAGQPAFCQGVRAEAATAPQIVVELWNLTIDKSAAAIDSMDSVGADGAIVAFRWDLVGTERCRRHGHGHDVRDGIAAALRSNIEAVRRSTENIHRRSWEHLLGEAASPAAWTCLQHRKDK